MQPGNRIILGRLAVALAIGLLVGLERGWERREAAEGQRAAGLRTFGLISLLGGVTALVAVGPYGAIWAAAVLLALGAIVAIGYLRESEVDRDVSVTTAVAALLTFGLGALAGRGELSAASSTAVVVALLLGFKPELHEMVRRIERAELLATLRLLLISVVILPVLPNRDLGPWNAFNPYRVWWMVVLVVGVSYVGYFAIRLLGERRGILATALFGGLVSSTAVALDLGRRARQQACSRGLLAAGVVIASTTMFPRMLVLVAAVAPGLTALLLWPLGLATAAGAGAAAWLLWRAGTREEKPGAVAEAHNPRNPIEMAAALRFGLLLAAVMVLARVAVVRFGAVGLCALAALSGLVDVDAITLSVASMGKQNELSAALAATAISLSAAVNTLVKPIIVMVLGEVRTGAQVGAALTASLVFGAFGLWLWSG